MELQPTRQNQDITKIAECVKRWGGSASIALLDPACEIYKAPHIEGLIGYRSASKDIFVFGDPVCEPSQKIQLAKSFDEYCLPHKKSIVYTQVSDEFGQWGFKQYDGALIEIGHEFFVSPQNDPMEGSDARMLRKKVHHALHEGATVHEYTDQADNIENAMEEVKRAWLRARQGPQIYLSNVDLFKNRLGKRWFYTIKENRIVGVCMLNRLEARQGWVIDILMATPNAPHGTTELLVISVLDTLRSENCHYLTFGVVAATNLNQIIGLSTFSTWLASMVFRGAKWLFNLDGRRKYWQKYKPESESSHLLFTHKNINICNLIGLMRAMNART